MFSGGSGGEAELWREDLALGAQGGGRTAGPHTVPENPPHVPGRVRLERPTPERRPGFLSGDVAGFPPAKGSRMLNIREHSRTRPSSIGLWSAGFKMQLPAQYFESLGTAT